MRNTGTFLGIIVMVGVFITATDTHWQISGPWFVIQKKSQKVEKP